MTEKNISEGQRIAPELRRAINEMMGSHSVATIYPWPDMQVGDSVLFQAERGESLRLLRKRVGGSASVYGKTSGKRFTSKLMPKENGFRVWRTQ
jgi:hypothetical protein